MAGANFWDAQGHVMSGSNDPPTRRELLNWIKQHEKTFYRPRHPVDPIGVYFSPATRNYFADEFLRSYEGVLILLMQKHLEFQVVTPRNLADFRGRVLVLPDVRVLDDEEQKQLAQFAKSHSLVVTGNDATKLPESVNVIRFSECPGKSHLAALEKDFVSASPQAQEKFLQALGQNDDLQVNASPLLATSIARVDEKLHVFFANFKSLRAGVNAVQTPETGATISVRGRGKGYFLPFLGESQQLRGHWDGTKTIYTLPPIHKGGVAWIESTR
jgi:hypothetical protein